MNNNKPLRALAIALLDDENGICEAGFIELSNQLKEIGAGDILEAVSAADGRYFLGENHGLVA